MRKRKRPTVKPEGVPPLTDFFTSKKPILTAIGGKVLRLYSEGYNQTTIAKRLGTSKQVVNYHVRILRNHGLITRSNFDRNAGGVLAPPFDVRFRYHYRKLTKAIKLPYDEEHFTNGCRHTVYYVRGCTVLQHFGDQGGYSIEITAGFAGGDSKDEAFLAHDNKALDLFNWLCEHWPALREAAGPLEIHRGGELCLNGLQHVAKEALEQAGASAIKGDGYKIDQSRGYPEIQITSDPETRRAIAEIRTELNETLTAVKELTAALRDLIGAPPPGIPGNSRGPGDHR